MGESTGKATYKVPHGKLITAKVTYETSMARVEITGDFFVHPEDGLSAIESSIEGIAANANEHDIAVAVQSAIDANNIQTIGIDAVSIAKVVKMAIR